MPHGCKQRAREGRPSFDFCCLQIVQAKAGPIILSKDTACQDFSFRAASVDNPMFQEFGENLLQRTAP